MEPAKESQGDLNQARYMMGRQLATALGALPPVEGRLANLILWIRAHSQAISESTRQWANEVGAPASFALPYFSRGGNFAILRREMERSFPNGPTLPDLTLDLVTFLSIKLRRRHLGDLDSLRKKFGAKHTRLDDYYRTVRLILRVASIHAPDAVVPLKERSLRPTDGVSPDLGYNREWSPRPELRGQMLLSWVYAYRGKLVESLDEWSRQTHMPRVFAIRFLQQPSDQSLRRALHSRMPDGMVIEDVAADLIIYLAKKIDAGEFGNVIALRRAFPSTNTDRAFGLSRVTLRCCVAYGVFKPLNPSRSRQ